MDSKKTGELISAARKEKNLTQRALADALHISDRTVSKWERGAGFPDVGLLEPLADTLGLSVTELLHGEKRDASDDSEVRYAVGTVQSKLKEKHRRNMNEASAVALVFLFLLFFVFAFADLGGAFNKSIHRELSAVVYVDGSPYEETIISIDGEIDPLYMDSNGSHYYQRFIGTVSIVCLPETASETVSVAWHRDGYVHFGSGESYIGELAYVDKAMYEFAFALSDGTIISTHEKYVPLLQLEDYYPMHYGYMSYGARTLWEWIWNK